MRAIATGRGHKAVLNLCLPRGRRPLSSWVVPAFAPSGTGSLDPTICPQLATFLDCILPRARVVPSPWILLLRLTPAPTQIPEGRIRDFRQAPGQCGPTRLLLHRFGLSPILSVIMARSFSSCMRSSSTCPRCCSVRARFGCVIRAAISRSSSSTWSQRRSHETFSSGVMGPAITMVPVAISTLMSSGCGTGFGSSNPSALHRAISACQYFL